MSFISLESNLELRQRLYKVVVSTQSSVGDGYAEAVEIANSDAISADNPYGGLDFTFSVMKTLLPEPNKASLTVMNLSPDVRSALDGLSLFDKPKPKGQKKSGPRNRDQELYHGSNRRTKAPRAPKPGRIRVEIEAGYTSVGSALIFRGDLRIASSSYGEDGTWTTKIDGEDGGRSVLMSRVNESFGPGTSQLAVVRACADALGLGTGNILEFAPRLKGVYSKGTILSGSAASELKGILRKSRLTYSVQDGELRLTPLDQPPTRVPAVLLSQETGMVGSPVRQSNGFVQVTSLLNPQLSLGGYVAIDSKVLSGEYLVQQITYKGSSFGTEWYAELELKRND